MNTDQLYELIRQPEGLKLDFKREFYHLALNDTKAREMQWGELIKDILALSNGNVNIAGEIGHIIFGVGDDIIDSGSRKLFDVGDIPVNRAQILEKVNSACSPPLADLHCEMLLMNGKRIFIISVPPSPHLHETTRRLITSRGQSFPEHTIFIRRGEGVHTASMPEIQAISVEKQRIFQGTTKTNEVITENTSKLNTTKEKKKRFSETIIDKYFIFATGIIAILVSIFGTSATEDDSVAGGIIGLLCLGLPLGAVYAVALKAFLWKTSKYPRIKNFLMIALSVSTIGWIILILVMPSNEGIQDASLSIVAGAFLGLIFGGILLSIILFIDWTMGNSREKI